MNVLISYKLIPKLQEIHNLHQYLIELIYYILESYFEHLYNSHRNKTQITHNKRKYKEILPPPYQRLLKLKSNLFFIATI